MLHEFLSFNHNELIRRCRAKATERYKPSEIPAALDHGVPLFLQQLVETLRLEQSTLAGDVAGTEFTPASFDISRAAGLHGAELLRLGYSVDQVVHEYGDICQSVTAIAVERGEEISATDFRTLNRCLDDAIAGAVASFGSARQIAMNDQAQTLHDRLRAFSNEHRRLVDIAIQSYSAIKTGNVGLTGATGKLLIHTLSELRSLVERTLPEIRLGSAGTTATGPADTLQ
jgi:hypothetical protein